jgi:hypothetical protein
MRRCIDRFQVEESKVYAEEATPARAVLVAKLFKGERLASGGSAALTAVSFSRTTQRSLLLLTV